jgi:hypothetical protein
LSLLLRTSTAQLGPPCQRQYLGSLSASCSTACVQQR